VKILDGGTGTEFLKMGITCDPVLANLSHPQAVEDLHLAYLQAGADVITANTFGAYSHKHKNFTEIIDAAMAHTRAAVKKAGHGMVALDMGPTGLTLEPYGDATREEIATIFAATVEHGAQQADLILIETHTDLQELELAVTAALKPGLPVWATMSFDTRGRTMFGASVGEMVELLETLGVAALGLNCGQGLDYAYIIEETLSLATVPIIFQPNAGLPKVVDGAVTYSVLPDEYGAFMAAMAGKGVTILGGCCGTTPAHIAAMKAACHLEL